MRYLTQPLLVTAFAIASSTAFADKPVDVVFGESQFFNGDSIKVLSLTSSGTGFEVGATVTVEGVYELRSMDSAQLGFYSTRKLKPGEKPIPTPIQVTQKTNARKGIHVFVLSKVVRQHGNPHLTFYHPTTGKPFGGVYFGDKTCVLMKKSWSYNPPGHDARAIAAKKAESK